jgi:hypothetical protein
VRESLSPWQTPSAAQVLRDVEIRFIERERFDQRCVVAEDRMDLARYSAIDLKAWRHKHQFRASPHGCSGRHRRAHAECTCLIAGRGNHASLGRVSNRHRSATEARVVALFDRSIERVHINVDDLARRHTLLYQILNKTRTLSRFGRQR